MPKELLTNRTFDEIAPGDEASLSRRFTQDDFDLFALVCGDVNPAIMDPAFSKTDIFHKVAAHGLLSGGLIAAVLGTRLPGPGTIYLDQSLEFLKPVGLGDEVTAMVTVREKHAERGDVLLDCRCVNQNGELVVRGTARVRAPREKIEIGRLEAPDVRINRHERFRSLLARAAGIPPLSTAVAHPCDLAALAAVLDAAKAGLIVPTLVGPRGRIEAAAKAGGLDISPYRLVDASHSEASAEAAVALVAKGEAGLLMKGSLHTDELLHAVLDPAKGLRTGRRLSHVYLFDVPGYPRPLLVTDAAVNISPTLQEKADIVQNAIDLAHVMGIAEPRVAVLSAVETVKPEIPSTVDAAALSKMAERGQIKGGRIDGPLAFDNAVSPSAAREKGIVSSVAGQADILLAPDLEAGNMLAKQLSFLANADAAGIVLGARVPIILTSRADPERTRLASCAVAVLLAGARQALGAKL
jgi:phosphate butyryltransferase